MIMAGMMMEIWDEPERQTRLARLEQLINSTVACLEIFPAKSHQKWFNTAATKF